jgi:hypothetical protein
MSDEGLKHIEAVGDERSAVSDAMRPVGVGDQGSSYRPKVKVSAFEACEQRGEVVFGRAAPTAHHLGHRVVERDRADGDRRLSRQSLSKSRDLPPCRTPLPNIFVGIDGMRRRRPPRGGTR